MKICYLTQVLEKSFKWEKNQNKEKKRKMNCMLHIIRMVWLNSCLTPFPILLLFLITSYVVASLLGSVDALLMFRWGLRYILLFLNGSVARRPFSTLIIFYTYADMFIFKDQFRQIWLLYEAKMHSLMLFYYGQWHLTSQLYAIESCEVILLHVLFMCHIMHCIPCCMSHAHSLVHSWVNEGIPSFCF